MAEHPDTHAGNTPPAIVPSSADVPGQNQTLTMMLNMQQQQMAMQQQITQLLTQLTPTAPTHNNTPQPSQRNKPSRPIIEADCTDNRWVIFKDAWVRYKQMAKLTDLNEIRNELRSACSSAVNELLFNFVGPASLNTATEDELLNHIRSVAVKTVHPEVYRQQFFRLKQSDGEAITHYVSRLKSQAMLCDFVQKCDNGQCNTSYSENMITSQLIAGLHNQSHQSKILSEVGTLKSLKQLVERLLTLESTEKAASHFQPVDQSHITPIKSDYQKNKYSAPTEKRNQKPAFGDSSGKCKGCGRDRHQKGRQQCPAQNRKCNKCGRLHHFANVCMSSSSSAISSGHDGEQDDVSFLSTISTQPL